MAALATEVKADIENGFGTWKVKLKVNISLFWLPPREGSECGKEGRRKSGRRADEDDSTQSTKTRENEVSRDRRSGGVGKGRGGWGRAGPTFVIVNGRRGAKAAKAALPSLHSSLNAGPRYDHTLRLLGPSPRETTPRGRKKIIRRPEIFLLHRVRHAPSFNVQ